MKVMASTQQSTGGAMSGCVCKPGNPCLWHHMQVQHGDALASEVPYPENYRLIRPRFTRLRERVARRLAPWAYEAAPPACGTGKGDCER